MTVSFTRNVLLRTSPGKIRSRDILVSNSVTKRLRPKKIFTWKVAQLAELTCNVETEVVILSF